MAVGRSLLWISVLNDDLNGPDKPTFGKNPPPRLRWLHRAKPFVVKYHEPPINLVLGDNRHLLPFFVYYRTLISEISAQTCFDTQPSLEVASGLQPRGWVRVGPLRSLQGGKRLRHTSACLGIDSSTRALSAARFAGATGRFGYFRFSAEVGSGPCCVIGIRWGQRGSSLV